MIYNNFPKFLKKNIIFIIFYNIFLYINYVRYILSYTIFQNNILKKYSF